MQVKTNRLSDTDVAVVVVPSSEEMLAMKNHVLEHFRDKIKLQGFREGKAPLTMVEKNVDPSQLQTQFLEETINQLYPQVIKNENLRPVDRPEITIKKFVPFTDLEFEAKVAVISEIRLPDYTKIKKTKPKVTVTAEDITGVLESLRQQSAQKNDVDRASKTGDQVWIDFFGTDAKGEPIKGGEGKDYPLVIGTNTFIPGFEKNVVGLKANESKNFTLTFPKDYGVKALAGKKANFKVDVTKVQEVILPKLDDEFAAKVGPFKTVKDLKDDIKKQLTIEKQQQADRAFESEIVKEIAAKTKVTIPPVLITDQVQRMVQEQQQNLTYKGTTYEEFLRAEGKTEDEYKEQVLTPQAQERVRASLVLAEIADKEKLYVTPEELDIRMQMLKAQYPDQAMQAELAKPEAKQDIASRMLTEKVLGKLVDYSTKK